MVEVVLASKLKQKSTLYRKVTWNTLLFPAVVLRTGAHLICRPFGVHVEPLVTNEAGHLRAYEALMPESWKKQTPDILDAGIVNRIPVLASAKGVADYADEDSDAAMHAFLTSNRMFILTGAGAVGGAVGSISLTPSIAVKGAFVGGVLGGIAYDVAATIVWSDNNRMVVYGLCETLYIVFTAGSLTEKALAALNICFSIFIDGMAGLANVENIKNYMRQLSNRPQVDQIVQQQVGELTHKYKELSRYKKSELSPLEWNAVCERILQLREQVSALIGDNDPGHLEQITIWKNAVNKSLDSLYIFAKTTQI